MSDVELVSWREKAIEATTKWEASGPTSLTVALLVEAIYAALDQTPAADRDAADLEARVRALADVLGQHQRLVSQPGGPCWCGTWPDAEHDTTWMEHVAVAQVAALSGPADEHPADGTGAEGSGVPESHRDAGGAWIVYTHDNGVRVQSIHSTEVEALRVINDQGYGRVDYCAWGQDITEAVR